MKILLFTDNHFCQYSSIIRSRGERYSTRLENQIESINWVEQLAIEEGCEKVFCLGDFFDKADLNAEELTALKEIKWNNLPHYFIVGNHEMGISDLTYSSAHIFESLNFTTLKFIDLIEINDNVALIILPYLIKDRRATLQKYIEDLTINKHYKDYIVLSHNDIAGIRYGQYMSTDGFDIKDIYDNCRLFINGHLHNQTQINDKILNLGNLTGQNFSEDALKYSHCAAVLDTDTFTIDLINNPYALHFYKLEILDEEAIEPELDKCISNSVVTIKTKTTLIDAIRKALMAHQNIIENRIITIADTVIIDNAQSIETLVKTDHIEQFKNYILEQLGTTTIIEEELALLV